MKEILKKNYGKSNFFNFLMYILTGVSDRHWDKFTYRCSYCDFQYSMIGRTETFDQDVKYILLKANLTTEIPLEMASLQSQHGNLSRYIYLLGIL